MLSNSFAKSDIKDKVYWEAMDLYKGKNYFSALEKIGSQYKYQTPDQNVGHFIEKLVVHTGTHYFNTYKDLELRKMNIPTTDLIMAKRNLFLKKYKYASKRLLRMPKGHRLYSESLLVLGTIEYEQKKYKKAEQIWQKCAIIAKEKEDAEEYKIKRYYAVIKESCVINIARMKFKQEEYEEAIKHYEAVPKASFKWPYLLLEKAWSYYYLGNYNRAIGILITYDSPLLESYFLPEAELLKALSYYKLCLYDDALVIVEKYYKNYAPKSNGLKKVINSRKGKLYFYNLMFSPLEESEKEHKFLRNLITQVSKRVKYNLDLNTLYALNTELVRSDKKANLGKVLAVREDLEEQINHYVKVSMYRFINEIYELSKEMFNLKLEILSDKRTYIYKSKKSNNIKRGSFENIDRKEYQEFWTFQNAFWADELGDYSLGLKSQCKSRK
jgi:hypothetical protein